MTAYYNEFDPFAAKWLRELMRDGLISEGDVDERDIREVTRNDVKRYNRVHLFAGIGGWDYALGVAGWTDEPVWTGSCPCQPLSCAGKQLGEKDDRHLWPEFYRLIRECRPGTVFGEQVASRDGLEWVDGISLDLEEIGYAVGALDLPAAGVGAPHIRQRIWWLADAECSRRRPQSQGRNVQHGNDPGRQEAASGPSVGSEVDNRLADAMPTGRTQGRAGSGRGPAPGGGDAGGVAYANDIDNLKVGTVQGGLLTTKPGGVPWAQSQLIQCRDGKQRRIPQPPVQSVVDGLLAGLGNSGDEDIKEALRLFPLASKIPNRVGMLRGAGNAICPQVAAKFIRAFMETRQ